MSNIEIISARFRKLETPTETGWIMLITVAASNLKQTAIPFVAKVGEQKVYALTISSEGNVFEGFLAKIPKSGDRLYVGYGAPNLKTNITYSESNETIPPRNDYFS